MLESFKSGRRLRRVAASAGRSMAAGISASNGVLLSHTEQFVVSLMSAPSRRARWIVRDQL